MKGRHSRIADEIWPSAWGCNSSLSDAVPTLRGEVLSRPNSWIILVPELILESVSNAILVLQKQYIYLHDYHLACQGTVKYFYSKWKFMKSGLNFNTTSWWQASENMHVVQFQNTLHISYVFCSSSYVHNWQPISVHLGANLTIWFQGQSYTFHYVHTKRIYIYSLNFKIKVRGWI